jgi:hypothetical protein
MVSGVLLLFSMRLCILTFALFPLTVAAQLFNFGVQGGVPAQPPLGQSDNIPFVLGPSVDIRALPWLSVETGVLYNRIGRSSDNFAFFYPENAIALGSETSHGSALEVPLLAKFRLTHVRSGWQPFLSAGPTIRRTSITTDSSASILSGSSQTAIGSSSNIPSGTSQTAIGTPSFTGRTTQWDIDPTIGVGVSFRTGRFHIEPEVRYSYWDAGKTGLVRKNQVNFLLGFRL